MGVIETVKTWVRGAPAEEPGAATGPAGERGPDDEPTRDPAAPNTRSEWCAAESGLARILEPADRWISAAGDEAREQAFLGKSGRSPDETPNPTDRLSVFSLACPPIRALAGFYGSASYGWPTDPLYFTFTPPEVEWVGARLEVQPADPPWPEDYSAAHRDMIGDLAAVAREMVGHFNADPRRVERIGRRELLLEIAGLLGRGDVHPAFRERGWKRIRRLLQLAAHRPDWAAVAGACPHVLDDETSQKTLRTIYRDEPEEWERLAQQVPRLRGSPVFSHGGAPGPRRAPAVQ